MKIVKLILILSLMTFSTGAFAQYVFKDIREIHLQQLKNDLPYAFNNNTSYAEVDSIIRYLMTTDTYQNVVANLKGNKIHIVGYPLQSISNVNVEGNDEFSDQRILEAIGIKEGAKFESKKLRDAGKRLKELYGKAGYLNTEITVDYKKQPDESVHVEFNIIEKEPCLVKKIEIISKNTELVEKLNRKMRSYIGDTYSQATLNEIEAEAREYFSDKMYLKSELKLVQGSQNKAGTEATLTYRVDSPYSYELTILGNDSLSRTDVAKGVGLRNLEVSSLDPSVIVEEKAYNTYLQKGFAHVKINVSEKIKDGKFLKNIILNIEEGPKVKITKFETSGRISKKSSYYVNFIKENSSRLLDNDYYNKNDLELGLENLVTHLKNQGYLRARVQSTRIEFSKDKSRVEVLIVLDEGPLTQIRKVRFNGVKAYNNLQLTNILGLKTNAPLRLYKLEEGIREIRTHYFNNGYLEMKIENEDDNLIEYNESGTEANIQFDIHEGPQITAARLIIDGNYFTKDRVIEREVDLEPGEILNLQRIEQIRNRLNKLGIFSRVDIRTLEANTNVSDRTLLISVSEKDPGLFRFGVGATSEDDITVRSYVGASYNNLWGTARGITGRLELKSNVTKSHYLQRKVTFGYFEPFMFGTRIRGRINLIHSVDETSYNEENDYSEVESSDRLDLLLENELTDRLKLIWTAWSISSTTEFDDPNQGTPSDRNTVALIGPRFELDYRNNPYLPKSGTFTWWQTQYSDPGLGSSEDVHFVKTEANFSFYIPIFESGIVWANAIRGGYLEALSDVDGGGAPGINSFALHGQSKIRGFGGSDEANHIPNSDQLLTGEKITDSSQYYLFKTEFRLPVPGYDFLKFVLFYDLGSLVINDEDKIDRFSDPQRGAYGLGFHFETPVGPVTIEYAKKAEQRAGESPERLHISIGSF